MTGVWVLEGGLGGVARGRRGEDGFEVGFEVLGEGVGVWGFGRGRVGRVKARFGF